VGLTLAEGRGHLRAILSVRGEGNLCHVSLRGSQPRAGEFAKANGIARVLVTYEDLDADSEIDVIYNPLPN
jgi:predicted dehydrogenase